MIDLVKRLFPVMVIKELWQGIMRKMILKGDPVDIVVDHEKCIDCKACRGECPMVRVGCFASIEDPPVGHVCIECEACVSVCRKSAIRIGDHPQAVPVGKMPNPEELLNLLKQRRSTRSFTNQEISEEQWEAISEALKYAPVGHNSGYIDAIIIEDADMLRMLSSLSMDFWGRTAKLINLPIINGLFKGKLGPHAFSLFSKLALFYPQQKDNFERGLHDPILFNPPAVMLFLAPKGEMMGPFETGMAVMAAMLSAEILGLGTCCSGVLMAMCANDYKGVNELVKVPEGLKVCGALIVGHPKNKRFFVPHRKERNVLRIRAK